MPVSVELLQLCCNVIVIWCHLHVCVFFCYSQDPWICRLSFRALLLTPQPSCQRWEFCLHCHLWLRLIWNVSLHSLPRECCEVIIMQESVWKYLTLVIVAQGQSVAVSAHHQPSPPRRRRAEGALLPGVPLFFLTALTFHPPLAFQIHPNPPAAVAESILIRISGISQQRFLF